MQTKQESIVKFRNAANEAQQERDRMQVERDRAKARYACMYMLIK